MISSAKSMQKMLNQSRLQILSAPAQCSTVQWFYICYEMKNEYSVASPAELSKLQVDWAIWQGSYLQGHLFCQWTPPDLLCLIRWSKSKFSNLTHTRIQRFWSRLCLFDVLKMCEKRFRSATSNHPCDLYQSLDACTSRLAQATKFQHLLNAWVCVKSLVCMSQTGIFRVARLFVFIVFPKPGLNTPQPHSALWKLTLSFSLLSWSLIRMSHFLPLHACDCLLLSSLGQRWRFPSAISLLLQPGSSHLYWLNAKKVSARILF